MVPVTLNLPVRNECTHEQLLLYNFCFISIEFFERKSDIRFHKSDNFLKVILNHIIKGATLYRAGLLDALGKKEKKRKPVSGGQ